MRPDRAIIEALAELARIEKSGDYEPAPVLLGPFTAYTLIGVLQLAWRHPDLSPRHKQMIEDIARPLSKLFGPPLSESIELGWNPDYDQEAGRA